MASIELIVTDLDGTLWPEPTSASSTLPMHAGTRAALDRLRDEGVPLIAATGRRRIMARRAFSLHDLMHLDAVLHDGALGVTATDVVFHACPFGPDALSGVVDVFESFGYEPVLETNSEDIEYILGSDPSYDSGWVDQFKCVTLDLRGPLPAEAYTAFARVDDENADALVASICSSGSGLAAATRVVTGTGVVAVVKVRPPACSKWSAVERYCEYVDVDPRRVLAIGDNDNDVELLSNAAVALAPTTASPAAQAAAHRLVPAVSDGGWAKVLVYL